MFNNKQYGGNMDKENKPMIRVKMKVGEIEFEIECQEEQLQVTVEKILSTITDKLRESPLLSSKNPPPIRAQTCKGIIQKLWKEGFFTTPRDLGEVHSEMARQGFHYDRTAVAHSLIDLVKEGILTRDGKPRRYRYAQKRPP